MNREQTTALLARNDELEKRTEQFTALLVQHDEELNRLLDAMPNVDAAVTARLELAIPALIEANEKALGGAMDEKHAEELGIIAGKLEGIRDELVSLAADKFTEAEKKRVISLAEIEERIAHLTGRAAKDIERGLALAIQRELTGKIPKSQTIIDCFRGSLKAGMYVQRGELWFYFGTTYLVLEDCAETPNKGNVGGKNPKFAIFAARGAGGGGGGGGDTLPSQAGNGGKFLKTDGTNTSWAATSGGGSSWVSAPAAAGSSGTQGEMSYAGGYFYVCIATNTWRRTPLTTF